MMKPSQVEIFLDTTSGRAPEIELRLKGWKKEQRLLSLPTRWLCDQILGLLKALKWIRKLQEDYNVLLTH